ncbi:RNA methyltransferase [Arenibacter sp. GZD96]|nr:RNA methyltransferase [Arenibacter sp. GZD-96]
MLFQYLKTFISQERSARFQSVLAHRTKYITVALEDVYQMHNTSAVVRSCDVFGIQEAHLIASRYGKRLDKNIAMGAEKWVGIHRYGNAADCMGHLRAKGYKLVATTPHDHSCLLPDFELDTKVALFFGSEVNGLSPEVLEHADGFLKIPMVGFTESLNISVSAAIILQILTTKLKILNVPWQLSADEKMAVELQWMKKSISSIDGILERYYLLQKTQL